MLEEIDLFPRHLVVTERVAGPLQLRVLRPGDGGEHRIDFDEAAYTVHASDNDEFDTTTLPLRLQLADDAGVDLRLRPRQRASACCASASRCSAATTRRATPASGCMATRRRRHRGADLAGLPPRPRQRAGTAAAAALRLRQLRHPDRPAFSSARVSLLDRGVVFAIAHVRGGGDLGRSWYEAGKMAHKTITFTDFIACAEAWSPQAGPRRTSWSSRAAAPAACSWAR